MGFGPLSGPSFIGGAPRQGCHADQKPRTPGRCVRCLGRRCHRAAVWADDRDEHDPKPPPGSCSSAESGRAAERAGAWEAPDGEPDRTGLLHPRGHPPAGGFFRGGGINGSGVLGREPGTAADRARFGVQRPTVRGTWLVMPPGRVATRIGSLGSRAASSGASAPAPIDPRGGRMTRMSTTRSHRSGRAHPRSSGGAAGSAEAWEAPDAEPGRTGLPHPRGHPARRSRGPRPDAHGTCHSPRLRPARRRPRGAPGPARPSRS